MEARKKAGGADEPDDGSFQLISDVEDDDEEDGESDPSSEVEPQMKQLLNEGATLGAAAVAAHKKPPLLARAEAATKGGTTRTLEKELLNQALVTAKEKAPAKKIKKKKKQNVAQDLLQALQALSGGKKESGKKVKKTGKARKKKKKRKVRLKDGTIMSLSASSSEESSPEPEAPSEPTESECEAPLKKRSLERPGSVLELLTSHAREVMDQSSLTNVGASGSSVTSGVKIMSYFMLRVKGNHVGYQREMRELHHLAACIDSLRRGDLGVTGDALAARFMAIHQSILDQGWQTARHMELYPMEESSAAGTALILASRKHAKLVAKSQGLTTFLGAQRGRGRGRSDWNSGGNYKGEEKGDKGRGKKGKNRGKGRGYPSEWTPTATDWKDQKEKPGEKTG